MKDFFTTTIGAWDDGSVRLTTPGIILVIGLIAALIIAAAVIRQRKSAKKAALTTKQLVYSATAMAVAMVCSMIKLYELPFGGSITLLSMLFIVLIGYWYGPYVGLMTGFAYGLLQFVLEPIFYTVPQMLLDYPLAFGALGLAGFFSKSGRDNTAAPARDASGAPLQRQNTSRRLARQKYGLIIGYLVGVAGRFFCSFLSGYIFFGEYGAEYGFKYGWTYSLAYQASYLVPEAAVTVVILMLPPVAKALAYVKKQAVN